MHRSCATAAAAAKSRQSCPTLCDPTDKPTRLPRPWDPPGKNTGAGCATATSSYRSAWASIDSGIYRGSGTISPWIPTDDCTVHRKWHTAKLSSLVWKIKLPVMHNTYPLIKIEFYKDCAYFTERWDEVYVNITEKLARFLFFLMHKKVWIYNFRQISSPAIYTKYAEIQNISAFNKFQTNMS